ncbi:MAG TPA: hypothetical protein VIG80_11560, partial [Bacillaceae bacterium]
TADRTDEKAAERISASENRVFQDTKEPEWPPVNRLLGLDDDNQALLSQAGRSLETFKMKCRQELSLDIHWDFSIPEHVSSIYKEQNGSTTMDAFVNLHMFEPLKRYKESDELRENHYVFITASQDSLVAQISGHTVVLAGLIISASE